MMEPKKQGWAVLDLLTRLLTRLLVSATCGFLGMLIVSWTALYFEAMPPEPQATEYATYLFLGITALGLIFGVRAAKIAIRLGAPLFMVCVAFVLTWDEGMAIVAQPDLNGDGIFTIRDFISAVMRIITATGGGWSDAIFGPITYETDFIRFLEISVGLGIWVSRISLTMFHWFLTIIFFSVDLFEDD